MCSLTTEMLLFWSLGALFVLTFVPVQPQRPTLSAVFPNLMRLDSHEQVIIEHGRDGDGVPVPCIVSLQNYPDRDKTFSVKHLTVVQGDHKKVSVMTKTTDLVQGSLSTMNYIYVRVQCPRVSFDEEAVVLLTGTKGYLFLQTDKPVYKPTGVVAIRAVSLNPDMRPANTVFTIDVLNPRQTIFQRFEGNATNGFFSKKVVLPAVTILGNWSVRASYQNKFQVRLIYGHRDKHDKRVVLWPIQLLHGALRKCMLLIPWNQYHTSPTYTLSFCVSTADYNFRFGEISGCDPNRNYRRLLHSPDD